MTRFNRDPLYRTSVPPAVAASAEPPTTTDGNEVGPSHSVEGDPARVPLITPSDLPEEYRDLFDVDEADPADVVANVHRAVANNPRVMPAWDEWSRTLYDAIPDARTRKLGILAVARATDSRYVWHQHVARPGTCGTSTDPHPVSDTRRVPNGATGPGAAPPDSSSGRL